MMVRHSLALAPNRMPGSSWSSPQAPRQSASGLSRPLLRPAGLSLLRQRAHGCCQGHHLVLLRQSLCLVPRYAHSSALRLLSHQRCGEHLPAVGARLRSRWAPCHRWLEPLRGCPVGFSITLSKAPASPQAACHGPCARVIACWLASRAR